MDGVFKLSKRPPYAILASYSMTVQQNHTYTIKVVASENRMDAYLDGVKRLSVTDNTYTTGRLGVILFREVAQYDDLQAWELP